VRADGTLLFHRPPPRRLDHRCRRRRGGRAVPGRVGTGLRESEADARNTGLQAHLPGLGASASGRGPHGLHRAREAGVGCRPRPPATVAAVGLGRTPSAAWQVTNQSWSRSTTAGRAAAGACNGAG